MDFSIMKEFQNSIRLADFHMNFINQYSFIQKIRINQIVNLLLHVTIFKMKNYYRFKNFTLLHYNEKFLF
jgi:hypothetical protein